MRLAEPGWLFLLVLVPLPWLLQRLRPRIAWPTLAGFRRAAVGRAGSGCGTCRRSCAAWRSPALAVALARPQTVGGQTRIAGRGRGDRRGARPELEHEHGRLPAEPADARRSSRLEAAKTTFARFVAGRPDDLIGLVVFANYPDLACPPTLDHAFLLATARGDPPRPAGRRRHEPRRRDRRGARRPPLDRRRRRRSLVLLTDGQNSPAVPPPARPRGGGGPGPRPGRDAAHDRRRRAGGGVAHRSSRSPASTSWRQVEGPDLALLERLARLGGGRAFVATDSPRPRPGLPDDRRAGEEPRSRPDPDTLS